MKIKAKSDQDRKYQSVSMHHEVRDKLVAMQISFDPLNTLNGFLDNALDFYLKYHCPQCGQETVREVRHEC